MGDSKRMRKLSLSYIRETIARRTTRQASPSTVCCEALDIAAGPAPEHHIRTADESDSSSDGESWNCTSAPNESKRTKPGLLKSLRKRFQLKSNTEQFKFKFSSKQKSYKPSGSCNNSNFKYSNSSHELYTPSPSSNAQRAICPMPSSKLFLQNSPTNGDSQSALELPIIHNRPPCDDQASSSASNSGSSYCRDESQPFEVISNLDEDLYTEAQSVFVDLTREGVGYETCDMARDSSDEDPVHSSPKSTSLTVQLLKLSKSGWYWGPISRQEAEDKLIDQPDGAFLVRDSSADRYLLSLSFRSNGLTLHTRIEHSFGLFSFYSRPEQEGFGSIVELIDHSMQFSQSGVFCYSRPRSPSSPAFPVRLTKPISRFTQVRSLQYLCRFVIRQNTCVDNIDKLPLPPRLKGYLEEGQF